MTDPPRCPASGPPAPRARRGGRPAGEVAARDDARRHGARPCLTLAPQPTAKWYCRAGHEAAEVAVAGRFDSNGSSPCAMPPWAASVALLPTWLVGRHCGGQAASPAVGLGGRHHARTRQAISVVYTAQRLVPPKVRVFVDALAENIGAPPSCDAFAEVLGRTSIGFPAQPQRWVESEQAGLERFHAEADFRDTSSAGALWPKMLDG